MDEKMKCTCKWVSCKRHGQCAECIAYHKQHSKHPLPFCQKPKRPAAKKAEKKVD